MLESLFKKVRSLKACNVTKKRHKRKRFPLNIAKSAYFEEYLRTTMYKEHMILQHIVIR